MTTDSAPVRSSSATAPATSSGAVKGDVHWTIASASKVAELRRERVAGELARAGRLRRELRRPAERDDVEPVGLGEDLVVVAREHDDVEAAGRERRLERAADERLAAEPSEVLPRHAARAAARGNEAEHPHPARSSSSIAAAAAASSSQSGSRGFAGASEEAPVAVGGEPLGDRARTRPSAKKASAVSWVK